MEFEDILLDVGDYGKYQRNLIMIFLVPAASLLPWFSMNILFMVSVPEHWCNVPELTSTNLSIQQQRSLITPPGKSCLRYNLNYSEILDLEHFVVPNDTTTRPCDRGFQYDQTYYDATAASKWNMVCEDEHYNSFILSMFNVGSIIGTPMYGILSDRIGRKITFFITILVTAVTAIASVLMTNFTAFVVIKTINGSLMPSVFQLPYIIVLELVAPEFRTRMNGVVNIAWTVGLCFLPLLAYLTRSWVTLGLLTSSVTIIYFAYYSFLPESPRWLVSQERYEEAAEIMYKIGEKNGKKAEKNELLQKLQKLGERMKKEKTVEGVKNSSADLLRYPQLRKKFIIISTCWMANIMSYYGLQLNISNLAGNEFINFFLMSVVELPGYMSSWFFMEKFGRRWCSVSGFLLTGLVCLLPIFDFPNVGIICSTLGKYFAAATFMATYQQSSELYPTVVRSLGMGMSSTIAMVITLIVPYIVYLSIYGKAIPFVIIGCSGILAGVMVSFLPETLNENLPQSIQDAEEFGRNQRYFSWNRRRRSISRERASSFGLRVKSNTQTSEDGKESKRSSQVLQNVEFVPSSTNSVTADAVKILNGGFHSARKRTSTSSSANDVSPSDSSTKVVYRHSVSEDGHLSLPKSTDVQSNDVIDSSKELPGDPESGQKFIYVNMTFDHKNENDNEAKRGGSISDLPKPEL